MSPPGSSGYSRTCRHPSGPESIGWSQKPRTRTKTKKEPQALKNINGGKGFVKKKRDETVGGGRIG